MIVSIGGSNIELDEKAAFDLQILLSELHGRRCQQVGECGDMEYATAFASNLQEIWDCHQVIDAEREKNFGRNNKNKSD